MTDDIYQEPAGAYPSRPAYPEAPVKPSRSVSPEEFVRAWQQAGSVKEVAAALGLGLCAVKTRAAWYRSRGIQLKPFRPGRAPIDFEALNSLARSLKPKE